MGRAFPTASRRCLRLRRGFLAVGPGRAPALRHEHRSRQAGRETVRPETRGLFPRTHLRSTPDVGHVLQRTAGEGSAPRSWKEILQHFKGQNYRDVYRAFGRLRSCLGRVVQPPFFPYAFSNTGDFIGDAPATSLIRLPLQTSSPFRAQYRQIACWTNRGKVKVSGNVGLNCRASMCSATI